MAYKLGLLPCTCDAEMSYIEAQLTAMIKSAKASRHSRHLLGKKTAFKLFRLKPDLSNLDEMDAAINFKTDRGVELYSMRSGIPEDALLACKWDCSTTSTVPAFVTKGLTQRLAMADALMNDLIKFYPHARIDIGFDYLSGRRLEVQAKRPQSWDQI